MRCLAHGACWTGPFCCRRLISTLAYLIRAVSSNFLWGRRDYCGLQVRGRLAKTRREGPTGEGATCMTSNGRMERARTATRTSGRTSRREGRGGWRCRGRQACVTNKARHGLVNNRRADKDSRTRRRRAVGSGRKSQVAGREILSTDDVGGTRSQMRRGAMRPTTGTDRAR